MDPKREFAQGVPAALALVGPKPGALAAAPFGGARRCYRQGCMGSKLL